MKKIIIFLQVLFFYSVALFADEVPYSSKIMEEVWQEFRQIHPYGYQTVALKHVDDACVFVISEPSESISEDDFNSLFSAYNGEMSIKHQPIGYDGWLADVVVMVRFVDNSQFESFTHDLFVLLYGTDYKAYYTDLDNPERHVYYSEYRLNYSISAAELLKWFVTDKEEFITQFGYKNIPDLLSSSINGTNELFYSKDRGFVVWVVEPNRIKNTDNSFKLNARKFALDADLIIGAFGNRGEKVALVARERQVPVGILPPLRIETIQLLATTKNKSLAQSYERNHIFAGKNSKNQDIAPIYLSDELWHTEYGSLLNITDQMLKSWTENGGVRYYQFDYPTPIDWAFNHGVYHDIMDVSNSSLTYNWNTAGAGYVIQDVNQLDVFAINRTGSLPVSFIPEGMEGKTDMKINEAEELAYDFFSELNNPDLVRVVQYATIYQVFQYFKSSAQLIPLWDYPGKVAQENIKNAPDMAEYEEIIENILRLISDTTTQTYKKCYAEGRDRYINKSLNNSDYYYAKKLIDEDPYGQFADYLGRDVLSFLLKDLLYNTNYGLEFDYYISSSIDAMSNYFERVKEEYGDFPYALAAECIVNRMKIDSLRKEREAIINQLSDLEDEWESARNAYHKKVKKEKNTSEDDRNIWILKSLYDANAISLVNKYHSLGDTIIKKSYLLPTEIETKALGILNWLLTDPYPYESPIGEYYAGKMHSHAKWLKNPSVACSNPAFGYGGHNLDAKITPIKTSKSAKRGYCNVTISNGQKIISVAEADKARITPAVLRTVERTVTKEGKMKLPEAPQERPKIFLLGEEQQDQKRGLNVDVQHQSNTTKRIFANGEEIHSVSDLQNTIADEIVKNGKSSIREIRFTDYSAREVHAYADNLKESIIERVPGESINLKDFNVDEDIQVVSQGDGTVKIILKQKQETFDLNSPCKEAMLDIIVPEKYGESLKESLIQIYKKSVDKINNRFKWKRELRIELQKTHPEIDTYDIKDEFIQLYGHLLKTSRYEIFFEMAA